MRVAIFGATGQVGSVMRAILIERNFPLSSIRFFASAKSAGKVISFAGEKIVVEDATNGDFSDIDIALFSAGATASAYLAPLVASSGAIVIDNSSAWRMDTRVPLVVPEVNGHVLSSIPMGIVANPNCTTMIAMSILKALDNAATLHRVVASTYQAVSGSGVAGVRELQSQLSYGGERLQDLTFDGRALQFEAPSVFSEPIAANVIPLAGTLVDEETNEEHKFRDESRKILDLPDLAVSATCVRVPVFTGHSLSLNVELGRKMESEEAIKVVSEAPGVRYVPVPTPQAASGEDYCLVGRVRQDTSVEAGLSLFISGDNLRKGAALNAVQIAEYLMKQPAFPN